MKKLLAASLLVVISGCASHGKTDNQIYMEALTESATNIKEGQTSVSLPSVVIQSHGMIADSLAVAAGGGQNATLLQQGLLAAKKSGEAGFLIIGGNNALDAAVMGGAFNGQDFSGLKVFFAGNLDQKAQIQDVVEKSKADFHFISRT